MNFPIWVWLYDYGPATHPEGWKNHEEKFGYLPKAYPQAHTYAFLTEKEAREHPMNAGWPKDHNYILQKTYLQTDMTYPAMSY